MASYDTVIERFKEICSIPHGSYNIDAISEYLVDFAKKHDLKYRTDEEKNVIIWKPATKGYENRDAIMLQGHMDMVAVKTKDSDKDMTKEGLDVVIDGDYMYARNTSLGGDDGIAVAYALALLESDDIPHPALECVFTVNEEVGMEGAFSIDLSDCKAKWLLNIDSEEEGVITVSCAGGVRIKADYPIERYASKYKNAYKIMLTGLKGGHSGTAIHEGRANAIKLMAFILLRLREQGFYDIVSIDGGEKDNAIPSDAQAVIYTDIPKGDLDDYISQVSEVLTEEFKGIENQIVVKLEPINETREPLSSLDMKHISRILLDTPSGVVRMCEGIDLVETSLNIGIVRTNEEDVYIEILVRSNINENKEKMKTILNMLLSIYESTITFEGDYPGWDFNPDSKLTEHCVEIYKKLYGEEPIVKGVHAGLECGIILNKRPDMEAVSIGPNILNIHSTEEKLDLPSVKRTWEYLIALISE